MNTVEITANFKVCECCGIQFECKANDITNCFCSKFILPEGTLKQVNEKYNNCLCELCLKAYSSV